MTPEQQLMQHFPGRPANTKNLFTEEKAQILVYALKHVSFLFTENRNYEFAQDIDGRDMALKAAVEQAMPIYIFKIIGYAKANIVDYHEDRVIIPSAIQTEA